MRNERRVSRRAVLGTGVALSVGLAGCTGGDAQSDGAETGADTATATDTETQTETASETTEEPGPTLAEFEYPDGAARDGIDAASLFRTHESTVTGAGSVTAEVELTREFERFSETVSTTNRVGGNGVAQVSEGENLTESLWSPSGEAAAYVEMASGFEQRYRIDNQAPSPNELARLGEFRNLLAGTAWSEAKTVVDAGEGYAAVYESTGIADENALLRLSFGEQVSEFEARVAVTQDGYVREIDYDLGVERDGEETRRAALVTVGQVGQTTVQEPDWAETARENGVRFDMQVTSDSRAVELEMVNGSDLPADSRLALSDGRGRGERQLSEPVAAGDRLFVGLSDRGELLTAADGVPDGARPLEGFVRATIRYQGYLFFVGQANL